MNTLPEGWKKHKVEKIIQVVPLTGKKIKQKNYLDNGKIPIIDQGKKLIGGYTNNPECKISSNTPLIIFGDHTRVFKFVDFDFAPGADGVKVLKTTKECIPKLIYYFMKALQIPNKGYARHFQSLNQSSINIPPIETQKKLLEILNKAEELRLKKEKIQNLSKELIQASFSKIFGSPEILLRTEPTKNLAEVAKIFNGITMNKKRREGKNKISYLTVRNLYREEFDLTDLRTLSVTKKELQKYLLEIGDICVVEGGTRKFVGRTAVYEGVPKPCIHQNHIYKIRLDNKILNPFFISAFFNSKYMQQVFFNTAQVTSGISSINSTELGEIKIPIPDMKKQNIFQKAYYYSKKIENSIEKKFNFEELFQSVLMNAYKGNYKFE